MVPTSEDPEWEDYLEMRRYFPSAMDNSNGFAIFGGRPSMRELIEDLVLETATENHQAMIDLAIRKEEFEIVCWPSFPQSRPYLRVPWEEARGFQYANLLGGSRSGWSGARVHLRVAWCGGSRVVCRVWR